MQILKTDCPHCGKTHNVYIQPLVAPQTETNALRMQLARAHEALGGLIAASDAALDALNELIGAEYDVMGEQWRLTEAVTAARAALQED